ncbi:uncharacterized protein LOC113327831 [Papaver somniferum]|uniref:uncharacterized protein LOC113327831 n=1 Tax=Papaver somniferum TaxID=3469 RepID=UPI000E6FB0E6|nr:uncharacterized protein LOC113327831 [Papaver somniferum]
MAPRNKTSVPGGKETLRHFTHPHVLIKLPLDQALASVNSTFTCDGCNLNIPAGNTYYCKQCDFGLHEDCATCPEHLTSNFHPNHQLERVWEGVEEDYGLLRPCDLCGDQVKGLFYKCSSGADEKSYYDDGDHYFFIHPTCSKLPSQVILKLQPVPDAPDAPCAICRNLVSSSPWSYRSGLPYGLNIHPQCVTLPSDDNHQVASTGTSRSAQQQVADAEADEAELFAAMYDAKMSAKTNQFSLDLWS